MKRTKIILRLSYIMLVFLLLSCGGTGREAVVDISGEWNLLSDDNAARAGTSFSDEGAETITLPGSWEHLIRKNPNLDATVWLRKKIRIDERHRGTTLYLSLGRIAVADETYFNGVKIGCRGTIPPRGSLNYHFSWQSPRLYFIPENLIQYGGDNYIAVKVYSHILSGITGRLAIIDYDRSYAGYHYAGYVPLIINISSIALNMFFFLGLIILFVTRRKKREYFYFSILVLLTIVGNFTTLDLPFSLNGLLRFKIFLLTLVAVNFMALHTVKLIFSKNSPVISWISVILAIPLFLLIILSPDSGTLVFRAGLVSLGFVNFCIITSAAIFFITLRNDPRRYWYFLFVAIPVPLSVIRNTWYLMNFSFNRFPMIIFFHVPLVCLIFTLYYIYDFERTRGEMNSLYTALMKKSKNYERLLKSLQKTSTKPEPRDIIHEVIDYLDNNYGERYDRKELSRKFSLNEDYMGQIFKKVTGMSVSNYINVRRIDAAKELLIETDAKIIDIAYHIGFDNLTHFHRQFKKQTNLTPNEYRTLMTKDMGETAFND